MTGKREWLLWILVVLGLAFVLTLSWMLWGWDGPAPAQSAEQRFAVYVESSAGGSDTAGVIALDYRDQVIRCDSAVLLTADHIDRCDREETAGATFVINLVPSAEGSRILESELHRYSLQRLVAVLEGEVISVFAFASADPTQIKPPDRLRLSAPLLGYAEPSRQPMEALYERLQAALELEGQ